MKRSGQLRRISITRREEIGPGRERPFLSLYRLGVVNVYRDGTRSAEYGWDAVLRRDLDAVVLVLVSGASGAERVCLRSCVRPPLALRGEARLPIAEPRPSGWLWELPAGLLESEDRGITGIRARAAAEALEETGLRIPAESFAPLGAPLLMSSGVIPERLHFLEARVERERDEEPRGDGSPAEERAEVIWVDLAEALEMCRSGEIEDLKTELGLRRLVELAGAEPSKER